MRKCLLFVSALFAVMNLLMVSGCDTCSEKGHHFSIRVANHSGVAFMLSVPATDGLGKWNLDGWKTLYPEETYFWRPFKTCIEDNLSDEETIELYLVDPDDYNPPQIFYDKDSLEKRNLVLRHYSLTYRDLAGLDFSIGFP